MTDRESHLTDHKRSVAKTRAEVLGTVFGELIRGDSSIERADKGLFMRT
jgi:hypothetical protein